MSIEKALELVQKEAYAGKTAAEILAARKAAVRQVPAGKRNIWNVQRKIPFEEVTAWATSAHPVAKFLWGEWRDARTSLTPEIDILEPWIQGLIAALGPAPAGIGIFSQPTIDAVNAYAYEDIPEAEADGFGELHEGDIQAALDEGKG